MVEVLLGLGGNLGDPAATVEAALTRLDRGGAEVHEIRLVGHAPRRGAVEAGAAQDAHAAETALSPQALLALIHRIEADLGRERRERWGPRPIDIDILTYGDTAVDEPGLTIPHPRLTERAFVLVPLAEIAGGVAIAGKTVREWAEAIDRSGVSPLSPPAARPRNPG